MGTVAGPLVEGRQNVSLDAGGKLVNAKTANLRPLPLPSTTSHQCLAMTEEAPAAPPTVSPGGAAKAIKLKADYKKAKQAHAKDKGNRQLWNEYRVARERYKALHPDVREAAKSRSDRQRTTFAARNGAPAEESERLLPGAVPDSPPPPPPPPNEDVAGPRTAARWRGPPRAGEQQQQSASDRPEEAAAADAAKAEVDRLAAGKAEQQRLAAEAAVAEEEAKAAEAAGVAREEKAATAAARAKATAAAEVEAARVAREQDAAGAAAKSKEDQEVAPTAAAKSRGQVEEDAAAAAAKAEADRLAAEKTEADQEMVAIIPDRVTEMQARAPPSRYVRVQRWLEREIFRGFSSSDLFVLCSAMILPQVDTLSDWAVVYSFYSSGDIGWYRAALSIQIIAGLLTGFLLCWTVWTSPNKYPNLALLAVPIGLVGLAPSTLAVMTLYTKDVATIEQLKAFGTLELIIEALPQAVLQTYVVVSFDRLDPLMAVSIFISLLGAGNTMFGYEAMNRIGHAQLAVTSKYGVVRVLALASTTAMGVFWVALLACAFKGLAGLAVVSGVCVYFLLPMESKIRDMPRSQTSWSFAYGSLVCCGRTIVCLIFAILTMGSFMMMFVFMGFPHVDNNYSNSSLPAAGREEPQHFDCTERTGGLYAALTSTILAGSLMSLSLLMDPQLGVKGFKGMSWKEQLAVDCASIPEDELPSAKVAAIWRWADRANEGLLEPPEIYRLAIADANRENTPEQRRALYEETCARFGASALNHQQLHAGETLAANQPKDDFCVTEAKFVAVMLELMQEHTKFLSGLVKGSLAKTADDARGCPYMLEVANGVTDAGAERHRLLDSVIQTKGFLEDLQEGAPACDACCRALEKGTRVHSCRTCNHDVCHECFAAGGAFGVIIDGPTQEGVVTVRFNDPTEPDSWNTGSFRVDTLTEATRAERAAHIVLAEYETVGEQYFRRVQAPLVKPENTVCFCV
eukprot:COSAG06_NODE_719_length_12828_cov_24.153036_7_plen_969_part_00